MQAAGRGVGESDPHICGPCHTLQEEYLGLGGTEGPVWDRPGLRPLGDIRKQ